MKNKIVVLGSINQDLIITTPRIPKMGETLIGNGFTTANGGKGANQAVAAARLGGEVTLIGAVGGDEAGKQMLRHFAACNIDIAHVKTVPGVPTGTAVITLYEGDNFIIIDQGANAAVSPEMAEEHEDVLTEAGILILQMEIPSQTVTHAIQKAKKYGVRVLLNPAPARPLEDSLLAQVDIFTPNETECEFFTGEKITSIDDAREAVAILLEKGVRQAVVTLGAQGAVYNEGASIRHCEAYPVSMCIDTTAAGDCFTAGLAVALTQGQSITEAVRFAGAAAAISVTRLGAQPSLPDLKEVQRFMHTVGQPAVR